MQFFSSQKDFEIPKKKLLVTVYHEDEDSFNANDDFDVNDV